MMQSMGRSLLGLFGLTLLSMMGAQMAFGDSLVLCSKLSGKLVDQEGAGQSGIRIVRSWEWAWADKQGSDEVTTDADGSFLFPEVTGSSWTARIVPHTPSIRQSVIAHGPDGAVEILAIDKGSYERDSELEGTGLTGPGINVVCRIDKEPSADGLYWGTCEGV